MRHQWTNFVTCLLLIVWAVQLEGKDRPSKKTMKKLCEMPEFQQAMAADEELEPAAVVYEVMTSRLEKLETHIEELEKKLKETPTQDDIEAVAAALRVELLDHVEDRMDVIASEIEDNVQTVLQDLMTNLARLGYEYGFQLETQSPQTTVATTTTEPPVKDCDYLAREKFKSGVHALIIDGQYIEGVCEIRKDKPAWLVIQRRVDDNIDFWKGWKDYKEGFGDLMGSFYFGNEKIHNITNSKEYVLRIEMTDATGDSAYAEYSNFSLSSEEDGFRLNYDSYIGGTAGNSLFRSKGRQFSTHDSDRDSSRLYSCSRLHHGAFWYDRCGSANLNGVYLGEQHTTYTTFNWQNIFWYTWKRDLRALKTVQMLIRPSIVKAVMVS